MISRFIDSDNNSVKKINLSANQSKNFSNYIYARHFEDGTIHIYNLIDEQLEIQISFGWKSVNDVKQFKISGHGNKLGPVKIRTNLKGIFDNRINIETKHKSNFRNFN